MITNSIIAYGDQLGAQMNTFADMIFIANENKTSICFYKELKNFRRGYCILKYFDITKKITRGGRVKFLRRFFLPLPELYCWQFKQKPKSVANWKRMYNSEKLNKMDRLFHKCITRIFYRDFDWIDGKNGVHCDEKFLKLDNSKNYDIRSGFGTYQDWKKYESEIFEIFAFKDKVKKIGNEIYASIKFEKQTVSVHFRKGDYLILSSLNLTLEYYKKALSYFDKDKFKLVIFSDDIDSCKETGLFDGYEVHYMSPNPAGVDMYIMSLCDNNIIANSTFSFWGAFLNKNKEKIVVCPHDFIGESAPEYLYINGNWYPDTWISI